MPWHNYSIELKALVGVSSSEWKEVDEKTAIADIERGLKTDLDGRSGWGLRKVRDVKVTLLPKGTRPPDV